MPRNRFIACPMLERFAYQLLGSCFLSSSDAGFSETKASNRSACPCLVVRFQFPTSQHGGAGRMFGQHLELLSGEIAPISGVFPGADNIKIAY